MGLGAVRAFAADDAAAATNGKKITGVLIDQMCAKKMEAKDNPQEAAGKHPKSCCLKCGGDAGYAIMADGKTTKLSDDSKDKVKEYLEKDDAKTTATVEGTMQDDGSLKVTSITATEAK
jgi:hypothetical protein